MFKKKLHREIEKSYGLKKGDLEKAINDLKTTHQYSDNDVLQAAKECEEYCKENKFETSKHFTVAFNLYVSCLNNPKK